MKGFFTLRIKLALVSLLLLAIPATGFWYAAGMKSYLMAGQEQALALTARAVATILNDHPELFENNILKSYDPGREIHAWRLTNKIQLDGNDGDWDLLADKVKAYDSDMILESSLGQESVSLAFRHVLARDDNYYYAFFAVTDDIVVHRDPDRVWLHRSDHLQIALEDDYGRLNRYFLSAAQNGWVNGHLMPADQYNYLPVRFEPDIEGYWRDTVKGYNLEIRLPASMVKRSRISFAVGDVDDRQNRQTATLIGTSGTRQSSDLGFLLTRSAELESILRALDKPQARISVVDRRKRLRASVGRFYGEPDELRVRETTAIFSLDRLIHPVVRLFSESYAEVFSENPGYMEEFQVEMLQETLRGRPFTTRRALAGNNAEVLIAGEPLRSGDEVMGAVIVEQPTNSILSVKNRIIEDTIKVTLLTFLFGALALFLFASRLSGRIRKLTGQTEDAIGPDGVIRKTFRPSAARDELGELSRRFAGMLASLRDYNLYQEKMADNLEHEIRTPVAGISAGLANLEKKLPAGDTELRRQLSGLQENVRRVENIMTSIREATLLDDALRQSEQVHFDLQSAVRAWVKQGYEVTFPESIFSLNIIGEGFRVYGDPERIRQMLDKIIENGVDFRTPGSPLEIQLARLNGQVAIRVVNQGPLLPEKMRQQIFQSMVSVRREKGRGPHLGLGLYVARKIAEFHSGNIRAENRSGDPPGVAFIITLPLSDER